MVLNHRSKSSRHRGSWTHGHGEKKKHRGAGSRGGRGNAGSGKRGDAKKPSYWKIKNFVGKHGFTNPTKKTVHTMTIANLTSHIAELVQTGMAKKEGDIYTVNLTDLGCDKLLGTGNTDVAFNIVVKAATKGAVQKIEAAKGSVSIEVSKPEVKSEE